MALNISDRCPTLCPGSCSTCFLHRSCRFRIQGAYSPKFVSQFGFSWSLAFDQSRLSGKSASASASTESLLPCFGAKLGGTSLSALRVGLFSSPQKRPHLHMYTPGQPQGFARGGGGGAKRRGGSIFDFSPPSNLYKKKSLHIVYCDTTVWQCKATTSSSISTAKYVGK